MAQFIHICEVCELEEILEADVAFEAGWDYPPRMYSFGVVSPRTCPNCPITDTVWWALAVDKKIIEDLTNKQIETLQRIAKEPESILVGE